MLRNAPATFQRLMDNLLQDCKAFTFVFIDDVAIYSSNWVDHIRHIRLVLDKFQAEGLTIQPAKSQLGVKSCSFLGHNVGNGLISPQEAKTMAVRDFARPRTKADVRAFLGLAGYYRQFIPKFSCIAAPLSDLTKAALPDKIQWTDECQTAFDQLRNSLCNDPILCPPRYDREFLLQTDASSRGIGAVLAQIDDDGAEHPIAYYSRKFLPRESRYSATEQEGLAVVDACSHFLPYLLGYPFKVITDHRALAFLANKDSTNSRLARWMDILRQFTFTIQYRPGTSNSNADALSRQAWPASTILPPHLQDVSLQGGEDVGNSQQATQQQAAAGTATQIAN